jgi:hypothetical protein
VLAFAGLRPGETVLEVEVGRGWMTELISRAVGPKGKVITQNPVEFAYSGPAMAARRTNGGLANVSDTTTRFDALAPADRSVDRVLWILGPHEIYFAPKNSPQLGDEKKTYAEIYRVLKPAGCSWPWTTRPPRARRPPPAARSTASTRPSCWPPPRPPASGWTPRATSWPTRPTIAARWSSTPPSAATPTSSCSAS